MNRHPFYSRTYEQHLINLRLQGKQQSLWAFDHYKHHDRTPFSCGYHNCPQCQQNTTSQWLARQKVKRLSVEYFMLTFTIAFELRALVENIYYPCHQVAFSTASQLHFSLPP
jgi:hypothetical protein